MWSRKRRKKEKGENKSSKHKGPEDSSSNKQEPHPTRQSSPISDKREGSLPPRGTRGYSAEPNKILPPVPSRDIGIKPQLSVPLPSAPLSVGILESLTSSLVEGTGDNATSVSTTQASLEMKQVIAKAQRSLINQLQQQLEGSTRQSLPHSAYTSGESIHNSGINNDKLINSGSSSGSGSGAGLEDGALSSSRQTQTFDYGNQSNKEFEKAADEQLQRNYYRQDWDM